MYLPGEYRKSDVLCQGGEEQFDNSVLRGLIYIIGSGFMGSGFWVLGSAPPLAARPVTSKRNWCSTLIQSIRWRRIRR
jgi:hypothetical protein